MEQLLEFYAAPGPLAALEHPVTALLDGLPSDEGGLVHAVHGLGTTSGAPSRSRTRHSTTSSWPSSTTSQS